jgi:hypothetical protein
MSQLPPMALEVTPEGLVIPVEAPACGERLDIPDRGIHLVCDRPAGHQAGHLRHRQIIQLSPPHGVAWCDDHCAQPCEPLKGVLEGLRKLGLAIRQGDG